MAPILVVVLSFTFSTVFHQSAKADYTVQPGQKCDDGKDPTSTTPPGASSPVLNCTGEKGAGSGDAAAATSNDEETCAVDKIGWILCPIIEQSAAISDKAFDLLADNFLRTDPELFSDKSGTKVAWEIARNLANIMFIIAFLVIILAQVTSYGISNYGIKKMLPRLIIAALAVNVSYYICQFVVDATNILGYELQNMLAGISNNLGPSVFGEASKYGAADKGGGFLTALAVGILASAGIVLLFLAPLGGVIMLAIITVVTIIIILLLRKALIVLLIVISPIAFVLYLLPNTEKFFSKWMSMFGKLLMVFPVVGLLFGAGQLASTIILVSGAQSDAQVKLAQECKPDLKKNDQGQYDDQATQEFYKKQGSSSYGQSSCGSGAITLSSTKDGDAPCTGGAVAATKCRPAVSVNWMLGLVAAGIAVAPLIAVWAVLKGALSAAGAVGGKITAAVSKGVDKSANGSLAAYKNSGFGKYRNQKAEERKAAVQAGTYTGRGGGWNPRNRQARLNRTLNESGAFNRVTGGYGAQRDLMAQALDRKTSKETVDMFNGDYDVAQAWAASGGDANSDEYRALEQPQKQQFDRMRNAGLQRKATSFLAAAEFLSENGQGSTQAIAAAIDHAERAGASATQRAATWESAKAGYRRSGRGDLFGEMNSVAAGQTSGRQALQQMQSLTAQNPDAMNVARANGWNAVAANSTHRAIGTAGSNAQNSYRAWLGQSTNNLRTAVQGLNGMEGRARTAAIDQIQQVSGQSIDQLRTQFNITN